MVNNSNLKQANKAKKDEFYTQMVDIEKEIKHYKAFFSGKVVLCNCDDPFESNFFKYFALNFNFLGLKKLIATCYATSPIKGEQLSLLDIEPLKIKNKNNKQAYKIEITNVPDSNNDKAIDLSDVKYLLRHEKNVLTTLKGDGDFRSEESIKLLEECDVVVTNPPFSLFRDFINLLDKYNKKYLIIGNVNSITYKEVFKLILEKNLWLGSSIHSGDREFRVPNDYPLNAASTRIDEKGNRFIRVKGVRWFTNIDYKERYEDIILYKNYNKEDYPKYENYDAINVDVTNDIPCDYFKSIGVPITFMDKYNPEQFEIEALGIVGSCKFTNNRKMEILKDGKPTGKYTKNAKGTLYKLYNPKIDKKPAFKDVETGKLYSSIYARIIISRKDEKNEN